MHAGSEGLSLPASAWITEQNGIAGMTHVVVPAAMRHVSGISRHVRELLDGAMDPPPEVFGSTTVEEHAACSFPRASAIAITVVDCCSQSFSL